MDRLPCTKAQWRKSSKHKDQLANYELETRTASCESGAGFVSHVSHQSQGPEVVEDKALDIAMVVATTPERVPTIVLDEVGSFLRTNLIVKVVWTGARDTCGARMVGATLGRIVSLGDECAFIGVRVDIADDSLTATQMRKFVAQMMDLEGAHDLAKLAWPVLEALRGDASDAELDRLIGGRPGGAVPFRKFVALETGALWNTFAAVARKRARALLARIQKPTRFQAPKADALRKRFGSANVRGARTLDNGFELDLDVGRNAGAYAVLRFQTGDVDPLAIASDEVVRLGRDLIIVTSGDIDGSNTNAVAHNVDGTAAVAISSMPVREVMHIARMLLDEVRLCDDSGDDASFAVHRLIDRARSEHGLLLAHARLLIATTKNIPAIKKRAQFLIRKRLVGNLIEKNLMAIKAHLWRPDGRLMRLRVDAACTKLVTCMNVAILEGGVCR